MKIEDVPKIWRSGTEDQAAPCIMVTALKEDNAIAVLEEDNAAAVTLM